MGNRPNINVGNRVNVGNTNNVNVNRVGVSTRPVRPWYGGWHNGGWYGHYYNYHRNWLYGSWNWTYRPWFWAAAGATAGWMAAPSETFVYSNPYYVTNSTTIMEAPVDYTQPLPLPAEAAAPTEEGAEAPPDPATEAAIAIFDEARAAFKQRDYAKALAKVDEAIKQLPSDATLHEFRGLTLFAMKKYEDAAAPIYAVLAAGPGWTWETVRDLYADPNEYKASLRALEEFTTKNPEAAYAYFLLAYHYLVINSPESAIRALEQATRLQPEDKLSAELLKALKQSGNDNAVPQPGK